MKGYPKTATDELRFALAGPAVTLAIAAFFALLAVSLPESSPSALRAVIEYQLYVNAAILVFNLLPAFPLDGGRVARALIWRRSGDLDRATARAAAIGTGLGYGMIALGLLATAAGGIGGIWLALVGFFVIVAARGGQGGLRVRSAFAGRKARSFMSFPAVSVPAEISVEDAVERYFIRHRFSAFPMLEGEPPIGLINGLAVEKVTVDRRATTTAGEVAVFDPELLIDEHHDIADLLERPAFRRLGRAIVLADDGRLGILSITDVERALRALDLRSAPDPPGPPVDAPPSAAARRLPRQ